MKKSRLTQAERKNLEEELRKRKGFGGNKLGIRELKRRLKQDEMARKSDKKKSR